MGEGCGGENLPLLYFDPINVSLVISFLTCLDSLVVLMSKMVG